MVIKKFSDLSLFQKMILFFSFLMIVTVLCMTLLFKERYHNLVRNELSTIAVRNTALIASNIDSMIENTSYSSRILLADSTIQDLLRSNADFNQITVMRTIKAVVQNYLNMTPHASAIYIFNRRGEYFGLDNYSFRTFSFKRIEDAPWYPQVAVRKGFYLMLVNAGESDRLNGDQNVISLVRNVYDLDDQPNLLGTVMLNMRESLFTDCFLNQTRHNGFLVTVTDSGFHSVLSGTSDFLSALRVPEKSKLLMNAHKPLIVNVKGEQMLFSCAQLDSTSWYVISAIPYVENLTTLSGLNTIYWLLLALVALLLFAGTLIIARLFTTPIHQLTDAMQNVEKGGFRRVQIKTGRDEIGLLKNTYNAMIDEIESLIARIENEAERKRLAELHALQMQIKPHFLNNTIDTARALALAGRSEDVNTLLRSLGQFYRNSISGGKEVISLEEEIDMVKNYLVIQKIRYGDRIAAEYDIDDKLLKVPVLKLILQPLVENAICHGLESTGKGKIIIRAKRDKNLILLSVSDDGVGMPKEIIDDVLSSTNHGQSGEAIGLGGTIDRLRLFYRLERPACIESIPNVGTCITIFIPEECDEYDV